MTDNASEEMAKMLTRIQREALVFKIAWSGHTRERLINLGLVSQSATRTGPRKKGFYEAFSYDLPLTDEGEVVRSLILKDR